MRERFIHTKLSPHICMWVRLVLLKVYISAKSDVRFLTNSCRESIVWTLVVALRIPYYKLTRSTLVPTLLELASVLHEYQLTLQKR